MPSDTNKKIRERLALSRRIESSGIETMPCSLCEKTGKTCVVSNTSGSTRCAECARLGKKCDVEMPAIGDWEALERVENKLDVEEQQARDEAAQLAQAMAAAAGRLDRLARQRKFLKKRGAEMLRRGLKSMDELEEAEAREAVEREKQASAARPPTPLSAGDPSEFPLVDESLPDFGNSFWEDLGFVDGNFGAI